MPQFVHCILETAFAFLMLILRGICNGSTPWQASYRKCPPPSFKNRWCCNPFIFTRCKCLPLSCTPSSGESTFHFKAVISRSTEVLSFWDHRVPSKMPFYTQFADTQKRGYRQFILISPFQYRSTCGFPSPLNRENSRVF